MLNFTHSQQSSGMLLSVPTVSQFELDEPRRILLCCIQVASFTVFFKFELIRIQTNNANEYFSGLKIKSLPHKTSHAVITATSTHENLPVFVTTKYSKIATPKIQPTKNEICNNIPHYPPAHNKNTSSSFPLIVIEFNWRHIGSCICHGWPDHYWLWFCTVSQMKKGNNIVARFVLSFISTIFNDWETCVCR